MGKYFQIMIQEDGLSRPRPVGVISQEASLDGIYVIRTMVPAGRLTAE